MIDWLALVTVLGVTISATLASVGVLSLGIRFLATPDRPGKVGEETDEEDGEVNTSGRRPVAATVGAAVCFLAFAGIVLFGIWLIVPYVG